MATTRRNRPDHDGKDRSKVDAWKRRILREKPPCAICGLPINYDIKDLSNPWRFTVDHVIAISSGGNSRSENLQPAHFKCNRTKGTRPALTITEINHLRIDQGCNVLIQAPGASAEIPTGYDAEHAPEQPTGSQAPRYTDEQLTAITDELYIDANCINYPNGGRGLKPELAASCSEVLAQFAALVRKWEKEEQAKEIIKEYEQNDKYKYD